MTLYHVEFGIESGKRGHRYNDQPPHPRKSGQIGDRRSVVVEVLQDVEREHRVILGRGSGEWFRRSGDVGLDQIAVRTIEPLQGAPGDVQPGCAVTRGFEGFEGQSPAAAGVQNARRG
jgi:hypothetical protein